jgi:glycosyltransferase involved in cell wall biosynthesis
MLNSTTIQRKNDKFGSSDKNTLPSQHIAICSVGELFGGVERHILGILSGLQLRGLKTLLFLFHDKELATQAREQGIETIILPGCNWCLLSTSRRIARIFAKRQIEIVHVHGYKATIFCALARRWHSFKMVKTEHGLPEPMSGRPMAMLRDRLYHILDNIATRMANATVCYVTEELSAYYSRSHSGLQSMTIHNGVTNLDQYQIPYPTEFFESHFNLAIIGRLDTVKGHHLAIKAIASENLPLDIHLYIIGAGPCESELRVLANTQGVSNRVHFLGFRRNVYDYMTHCHVLLMPSLHEGLPYTLLEAMALGTPIVASRVGGLAEILKDGITALLIPPGDIIALAQAIVRLHDVPGLRQQLSENARKLQQTHYSLDMMVARYIEAYRLPKNAIEL